MKPGLSDELINPASFISYFFTSYYQLPTTNYQLPTTDYQLPTTNYRLLTFLPLIPHSSPLIPECYFGAVLYKYIPISKKTTFGNHTASKAVMVPLTEKEVDMVENNTYSELKASPIPK